MRKLFCILFFFLPLQFVLGQGLVVNRGQAGKLIHNEPLDGQFCFMAQADTGLAIGVVLSFSHGEGDGRVFGTPDIEMADFSFLEEDEIAEFSIVQSGLGFLVIRRQKSIYPYQLGGFQTEFWVLKNDTLRIPDSSDFAGIYIRKESACNDYKYGRREITEGLPEGELMVETADKQLRIVEVEDEGWVFVWNQGSEWVSWVFKEGYGFEYQPVKIELVELDGDPGLEALVEFSFYPLPKSTIGDISTSAVEIWDLDSHERIFQLYTGHARDSYGQNGDRDFAFFCQLEVEVRGQKVVVSNLHRKFEGDKGANESYKDLWCCEIYLQADEFVCGMGGFIGEYVLRNGMVEKVK